MDENKLRKMIIETTENLKKFQKQRDKLMDAFKNMHISVDDDFFMEPMYNALKTMWDYIFDGEYYEDSLEYFMYECEFGNHPLQVTIDNKTFAMDSVESFADSVIEEYKHCQKGKGKQVVDETAKKQEEYKKQVNDIMSQFNSAMEQIADAFKYISNGTDTNTKKDNASNETL